MEQRRFYWPNGAHVAVVFHMAWEAWPENLGTRESMQNSNSRPVSAEARFPYDSRVLYEHAFAETGGIQRLLNLYERWQVPVTCVMSGVAMDLYPSLAKELDVHGFDLGIQPWDHEYLVMSDSQGERAAIESSYKLFRSLFDRVPSGFVAPGARYTDQTYEILSELGIGWALVGLNCESPYIVRPSGKAPLVLQPLQLTDYESYGSGRMTPENVLRMAKDEFDVLYEEGATGIGKIFSYAAHPFLSSGSRTRPLEELIRYIKGTPNVWITTRRAITEWVVTEFPDLTLDALYGDVATASNKRYHLGIS